MKNLFLLLTLLLSINIYAQPDEPTVIGASYLLGFLSAYNESAMDLVPGANNYYQDASCGVANFTFNLLQRNPDSTVTFVGAGIEVPAGSIRWYSEDSLLITEGNVLDHQTFTTNDENDTIPLCDGYLGPHNGMRYHGIQFDYGGATYERYFWGFGQVLFSPQPNYEYDNELYTIMFSYTWLSDYETWGPYEFIISWEYQQYDWDGDWSITVNDLLYVLANYGSTYEP